jgi:hypothetical protein
MDWGEDRGHKRKSENKGITYLWLFFFSWRGPVDSLFSFLFFERVWNFAI